MKEAEQKRLEKLLNDAEKDNALKIVRSNIDYIRKKLSSYPSGKINVLIFKVNKINGKILSENGESVSGKYIKVFFDKYNKPTAIPEGDYKILKTFSDEAYRTFHSSLIESLRDNL